MSFLAIVVPATNTQEYQQLIDRLISLTADADKLRAMLTSVCFSNPPMVPVPDPNVLLRLRPGNGPRTYDMDIRLTFTVPQPEPEFEDEMA